MPPRPKGGSAFIGHAQHRSNRHWRQFFSWTQRPAGKHRIYGYNQDAFELSQIDKPEVTEHVRNYADDFQPIPTHTMYPAVALNPMVNTILVEQPSAGLDGQLSMDNQDAGRAREYQGGGKIVDKGRFVPEGIYLYVFELDFWLPNLDIDPSEGTVTIDLQPYVKDALLYASNFPPVNRYPSWKVVLQWVGMQLNTGEISFSYNFHFRAIKELQASGHIIVSLTRSRFDFVQYNLALGIPYTEDDLEDGPTLSVGTRARPRPGVMRRLISRLFAKCHRRNVVL